MHIFILHHFYYFDWHQTLQDSVCSSVILSLCVWSVMLLIRAYPTTAGIYVYAHIIGLVGGVAATAALWLILNWFSPAGDTDYTAWVKHSLPVRFVIAWILNSLMATNAALRKNIFSLEIRFQQQADASVLLKEAELFKLRQQLQPHFLYNSFNSISALIVIAPGKAQEMIGKLSDFLRSSVKREAEDMLPLSEELVYIQSYLDIESVRFGDRLQVDFEKKYTDNVKIPPFLLQPVLENAIKFGLYGKTGIVRITLLIVLEGNVLYLTITNPYDALLQPPRGTGFGLESIRRRLYLLYGRNDLLETNKNDQFFTTVLKIPC